MTPRLLEPLAALLVVSLLCGCSSTEDKPIRNRLEAPAGSVFYGILGFQEGESWSAGVIGEGGESAFGYVVGIRLGRQGDAEHQESPEHRRAAELFSKANRETVIEEAIRAYVEILAMDPLHPEPANNLGIAFLKLGRRGEVEDQFERALQIDSGFQPAQDNLDRFHRSDVYFPPESAAPRRTSASPAR